MTSLSSESTISHYKIKGLIAAGGMGQVYKAIDLQLGRIVALKTVLPARAADSNTYHRFLREARAASILSHPSICTIYEIGEEGDLTFIAMQYLEGKTIQTLLEEGPIRIDSALSYALNVADALEEAHRNGVVHRDIKPSNIIVNERQTAVVLDFGLAKQVSFAQGGGDELPTQMQLTSAASLVGTGPYMSPEQILGEPVDARSDIFSFGVTFYEMLAGRRPFDGVTTVDVLHSILHDKPKRIDRVRQDLDETLAGIVAKMLDKDKDERYQSARELKDDLLNYIQAKGYTVRGVSSSLISGISAPGSRSNALLGRSSAMANWLTGSRAYLPFTAILLIAFAFIGAIWLGVFRSPGSESNQLLSLRHVPVINWKNEPGGYGSDAVLSHDGRMIAFSSIRGKYQDIWIKQTTMGDANQITKGEWNNWNPIWAPDNQQIAFVSVRGGNVGIWRMPALGGTPTLVGALGSESALRLRYWSKDGATLYYELFPNLFAIDVATRQTRQVTSFNESEHSDDLNFAVSPKEDRIAYLDRKNGQVDVWSLPIGGGAPVQVTHDAAEDRNPVWHPDGQRIIYSCMRDGIYQVCVAFLDGREPVQITSGETDKFVSDVSGIGTSILYAVSKEESDIWGVKVDTGEEVEITSDAAVELWPSISPDGKTIAYQSITDPGQGNKFRNSLILASPVRNEGPKIQLAAGGINPNWSPDGGRLAFLRPSGDTWNVWTVRATSGDEKQLTNRGVYWSFSSLPYNRLENVFYSWSPDGSKIAYPSQDAAHMWVVAADGSLETPISSGSDRSLYSPLWLPDSSGVAYVSWAKEKSGERICSIWLADLKANKYEAIFQGALTIRLLGWLGAKSDLLMAKIEGQKIIAMKPTDVDLVQIPKAGGAGQMVATLKSAYISNIHLSPDGQTIAFVARQDGKDNVWLTLARGGEES
jgi:serine/threonine protein kinase